MSKQHNSVKRKLFDQHGASASKPKKNCVDQTSNSQGELSTAAKIAGKSSVTVADRMQRTTNKVKTNKKSKQQNNNATILAANDQKNAKVHKGQIPKKTRSKVDDRQKGTIGANKIKVIPIIQTRGMKQKAQNSIEYQVKESEYLNNIDKQTFTEFVDGENAAELDPAEVSHDDVELSVNGSDLDDFPDHSDHSDHSDEEDAPPFE